MSTTLNTDKLECITNESSILSSLLPKRGRGRPAKYAPEEREQKYKELSKQWTQTHMDQRSKKNEEYASRTRKSYQLLTELWHKRYLDNIDDPIYDQIKELIENKKIVA
jgi:hypothetical protein